MIRKRPLTRPCTPLGKRTTRVFTFNISTSYTTLKRGTGSIGPIASVKQVPRDVGRQTQWRTALVRMCRLVEMKGSHLARGCCLIICALRVDANSMGVERDRDGGVECVCLGGENGYIKVVFFLLVLLGKIIRLSPLTSTSHLLHNKCSSILSSP